MVKGKMSLLNITGGNHQKMVQQSFQYFRLTQLMFSYIIPSNSMYFDKGGII